MDKRLQQGIVKFLGGVGYIAVFFQWLQVVIAWLPGLFESRLGRIIFPHSQTIVPSHQPVISQASGSQDFVTVFLVTCVAIAMIGLVAYVVTIRYTKTISKTSSKVTHSIARQAVHVIARKPVEQLPVKKRIVLNRSLLFWTKLVFAVLPFGLLAIALHDSERGIMEQLALFLQAVLALVAVIVFLVQAVLAARWHERTDNIS